MSNIVINTDNRNGNIIQTTIINRIVFKPQRWLKKTFRKKKYYQDLTLLLSTQLQRKIEVQKTNKKYIPDIFLELNEVKESLRYVTQPILFYKKEFNEIKNIEFYFFNEVLERLGFEKAQLRIDNSLKNPKSLSLINKNVETLKNIFKEFRSAIPNTMDEQERLEQVLSEEQYKILIKEQGIHHRFGWFLDNFEKKFDLLTKKFILLTEKAGQGKTNLICDFIDKVMLKKNLFGTMFTGNEFNNLSREEIEDVILKDIYGFNTNGMTFDNFLNDIEYLCKQNNSTFTILIDGLNENSNIEHFSAELYKFVEKILQKDYIRLIFTCRSEYFDERFKIFKQPSFEKDMLMMDNYMSRYHHHDENLPQYLEDRLIKSYFNFFQVENTVFDNVKTKLAEDFLLLRIFSEVYGKKTNPNACMEQVYDIYKDELFKQYFEFKKEQLDNRTIYSLTDFQKLFKVILNYMIDDNHQYINIPFEELDDINMDLLNHIIDEDIFFRKDLIKDENSILGNSEVLNFTFDEFRDYLLADYLVNSDIGIKSFLESISEDDTSIEGIKKYLFFKSRKNIYREKLKFLEILEDYNDLFLDNIFSIKDEDVIVEDINKIKELFLLGYSFSKDIIYFLMYRHHTKRYKKLNIFTLFEIITSLTDEQYDELVNPKFKIKDENYLRERKGNFLNLIKQLEEIIGNRDFNKEYQLNNIFEWMFLLLAIEDEYEYEYPPYELIQLLQNYIDKYPNNAKIILLKYQDIKLKRVQLQIWKLLNYYADKQIDFNEDFCNKVFESFIGEEDTQLNNQKQSFLEKCYQENQKLFNIEQKKFFYELEEMYKKEQQDFRDLVNENVDLDKFRKSLRP